MTKKQMLVNYVPGEECRLAVTVDGRLEELHAERLNAVSHVGNIYVGRVVNVEPAIQAAFVDFGLEHNGFLHISDLHPRYFPGEEKNSTESVGRKTPRRERPPIQHALKRGQEITVQVLKEGIGTKGPTLTSYLSIPGRYLVMMPDMDKVGVSRKVEDDEQRQQMRDLLDQMTLPEGFGFILRTAGLDRTKTDIKRDLAYLQRLWKDMERRRKSGNRPRLLYAESDLLVRALRDILTPDIEEIVIDHPSALQRAGRFLKIISPRHTTRLLRYEGGTPVFHAFGVEDQIRRIFTREVPLPSGGSLVIDETEALVAIDVNSGRMRHHGDAETTAYKTNIEAVDEICRQLKLRDLGGLVLMDLIDMRSRAHRKQIETLLKNHLKNDRAKTKALPISQFGIVELTRQRMRGSARSTHYAPCPTCESRGHVQRPDSVANEAMRELAALLDHQRVHRVEMVVSPRVASELLSNKRRRLAQLERLTNKHVDVRVSETIVVDRLTFYAYDDRGADIEIEKLPPHARPTNLPEHVEPGGAAGADAGDTEGEGEGDDWAVDPLLESAPEVEIDDEPLDEEPAPAPAADEWDHLLDVDESALEPGGGKKKRRRRGGRGRRRRSPTDDIVWGADAPQRSAPAPAPQRQQPPTPAPRPPTPAPVGAGQGFGGGNNGELSNIGPDGQPRKRRRRRGRRGRGGGGNGNGGGGGMPQQQMPMAGATGAPAGARGDSWDIVPSQVTPAAADPRDSRADSWDVEPAVAPAAREDSWDVEARGAGSSQEAADEGNVIEEIVEEVIEAAPVPAASRADSWDVEPAAVPVGAPDDNEAPEEEASAGATKKRRRRRSTKKPAAVKSEPKAAAKPRSAAPRRGRGGKKA